MEIVLIWIISIPLLITLLVFVYKKLCKKQIYKSIRTLKTRFNAVVNMPIAITLERIQRIAHHNRNFQVGYDVWKVDYKNEIVKERTNIQNEIVLIERVITSTPEIKLKELLHNLDNMITNLDVISQKFLSRLENFSKLDEIHREEISYQKKIFREMVSHFNEKKVLSSNSADYIEKDIDVIEDLFSQFEKVIKKADFNRSKNMIITIGKEITSMMRKINIAPQINGYCDAHIPNIINILRDKIETAKEDGSRIQEIALLATLKSIEEEIEAINLTSKLPNFVDCESLIEKNLKKLEAVEKNIYSEVTSKKIFLKNKNTILEAVKKTFSIIQVISPQIIDIKSKAKLTKEEMAEIIAFRNKVSELKNVSHRLKSILEKEVDHSFKELLESIEHLSKVARETLKAVLLVFALIDSKENDEIRCEREFRNISLGLSELISNLITNNYTKNNQDLYNFAKRVKVKLMVLEKMLNTKPRSLKEIESEISITRKLLDESASVIYSTIERYNICEKQLMWLSRYKQESLDLNQILDEAEISFKARNLDEVERLIVIAKVTSVIKKHKKG